MFIELPDAFKPFIDAQTEYGPHYSPSEYVGALIRAEMHRHWKARLHEPEALFVVQALIERDLASDDDALGIELETLIDQRILECFPVDTPELEQNLRGQEWRKILRHLWEEGIPDHFANAEELLAEAKRRYLAAGDQHLKEALEEALNEGATIEVDEAFWEKLYQELEEKQ
jgi:Arc/MetJ-type ribon-helix-helix transcriptional regulator